MEGPAPDELRQGRRAGADVAVALGGRPPRRLRARRRPRLELGRRPAGEPGGRERADDGRRLVGAVRGRRAEAARRGRPSRGVAARRRGRVREGAPGLVGPARRIGAGRGSCSRRAARTAASSGRPTARASPSCRSATTHALVGVYQDEATPIRWIAPSTSRDSSPRCSPDGKRLVFVRRPGTGGAAAALSLEPRHQPWSLWTADAATGAGTLLWTAPETLRGSFPTTHGEANLHWADGRPRRLPVLPGRLASPLFAAGDAAGGEPLLLTPGDFMAEHVTLSPDRRVARVRGQHRHDARRPATAATWCACRRTRPRPRC